MSALTVRKVESDSDFKAFFEFPWTIYKDDPNWVPPLLSIRKKLLDRKKNPSWEYLTGDYFVAWRGSEPVGTITAFINHRHNETWQEKIGWFGLFETYDDPEISQALLDLHAAGCELITITQYLRPTPRHHPVERWVKPEEFVELRDEATEIGFVGVMSGPLVRSSYRAGRLFQQALASRSAAPAPVR